MSQQAPSPAQVRHMLRCVAARQNTSDLLPVEPQPGCSRDPNENEPETEPVNDEKNLMILIDDCLLKIFDLLKLKDIGHVAHVNVRLNDLAKYYFETKYRDVRFENNFDIISFNGRINAEVAQAFLHIFGYEIAELKLRRASFNRGMNNESMYQISGLLEQHCSSNIKKLKLHGFGTAGGHCKMNFGNLEELTFEKSSGDRDGCIMIKLNTFWTAPNTSVSIPVDCFGELVEARLSNVHFERDDWEKSFKDNRKIKILCIDNRRVNAPAIFSKLPCLKELEEFDYDKRKIDCLGDFHHLYTLKKLKILKMSFHNVPPPTIFEGFVKSGIAIEHLEFRDGQFSDETVSDIVKMRTLKVVKLYNVHNLRQSHILHVARQLKRLEELHIHTNSVRMTQGILMQIVNAAKQLTCLKIWIPCRFNLDVRKFRAILSILQKRYKNNTLELTIYGDGLQTLSVPDKVLKGENERWLKVIMLER